MNKILYGFVSVHSFLIGMFTFFIPVFLYKNTYSLGDISLFISLGGLSFCISLYLWDRIRFKTNIIYLVIISFVLEIFLISFGIGLRDNYFLYIFAVLYGAYECFFWITKRLLFVESTQKHNVGNTFGNIQILSFLLVKIGILLGSFILQNNGYTYILIISIILSSCATVYFIFQMKKNINITTFSHSKPIVIKEIFKFKDTLRSKIIFLLDGPFLYFESFFWLITLFIIVDSNYTYLGYLIVILAIIFSLLFLGIKRTIDKIPGRYLFIIITIGYSISWFMRGYIGEDSISTLLMFYIVFITFFTSLFRLFFNKQFFGNAKQVDTHKYLVIKSYYSQFSIFIVFGLLSLILNFGFLTDKESLSWIYFGCIPLSIIYLSYKNIDLFEKKVL